MPAMLLTTALLRACDW